MRAVIQRVSSASVASAGETVGSIERGFLIFVGVEKGDSREDAEYLAEKCAYLRAFEDENGKMNLSILETNGKILAVSNFTLLGDCRKGRRPSFFAAELPNAAVKLYEHFLLRLRSYGIKVENGVFRTHMDVSLVNDGPVTLIIDSRQR